MPSPQIVSAGALCAVAVALTACSGGSAVDPAVAAVLADRAERLADHLDADAGCEALTEADQLLELTASGVDDGSIAVGVAAEVEAVVADVTAGVACDQADDRAARDEAARDGAAQDDEEDGRDAQGETGRDGEDDTDAGPDEDDKDDKDNAGKAKGKGNGKGNGNGKDGP